MEFTAYSCSKRAACARTLVWRGGTSEITVQYRYMLQGWQADCECAILYCAGRQPEAH